MLAIINIQLIAAYAMKTTKFQLSREEILCRALIFCLLSNTTGIPLNVDDDPTGMHLLFKFLLFVSVSLSICKFASSLNGLVPD